MNRSKETDHFLDSIAAKTGGKSRIVFVSGTFNIVHPGHLRLLRFASECGDSVVVGVLSDDLASNAQLPALNRLEGVSAINWVTHAFIQTAPSGDIIKALRPAVVVMGREHEHQSQAELEAVQSYGGQLLFSSGDTRFSSIQLLRAESEIIGYPSIVHPKSYITNHNITIEKTKQLLSAFSSLKVCVIGDIIVDEYVQCDPLGMSQEDPTIVVTPILENKFLGGAGIVAAHARSLGAERVTLISAVGNDTAGEYATEMLGKYGVTAELVKDDSRPTTVKRRYRAGSKTLLRVNHLRQHKLSNALQRSMLEKTKVALADANLIIFSDFNYGALPQELVDQIAKECSQRQLMMVADSQSSSQTGDVSRFKDTMLLTPTEREARLALGNYDDGLVVIAEALRQKTRAQNIVITLGSEGLLVHAGSPNRHDWLTDRLPALNSVPKDTAGAGDCLLVCTSLAMATGSSIWHSIYLGSIAAACQVARIGNIPLSTSELLAEVGRAEHV